MKRITIISVPVFVVVGLILISYYIWRTCANLEGREKNLVGSDRSKKGPNEEMDVQFFDLPLIAKATNYFSINKKLGEGGSGPGYRVTPANGQEIAVKRLSRSSGQGLNEFKNEVALISQNSTLACCKAFGMPPPRREENADL